ncbi:hypothetical protein EPA93_37645 [Ktedonosporobacter rubrisoli]|uniref:Uncharacterized protein n=1 Tax=Ktedonosporobacter rubrisoli TaxID=2509675 RepID=A0A4P6K0Q4_KTERU|nr:hypothetical protein [Ktedonosporobacter rubrisoli]QBD81393.1 hypothetical protein EPA93_37645 [Ktedonosporobacter rubrisoli]
MSSLPFTDQQCFFIAMLVFIVIGFMRGWRRELVSLVFVLLAVVLMRPDTSQSIALFLARIPGTFSYFLTGKGISPEVTSSILGPWWPLLGFLSLLALGYYVGNRAFPTSPATPQERFLGVIPAVVSGAFVLAYFSSVVTRGPNGQPLFVISMQAPNPVNYIPVIFIIAIVAVVIALIAARAKKTTAKK